MFIADIPDALQHNVPIVIMRRDQSRLVVRAAHATLAFIVLLS